MNPPFQLQLIGPVTLTHDGVPLPRVRRKSLALLIYLTQHTHPVRRDELADLFWPEQPLGPGRRQLSWAISNLAADLPPCVETDRHTVRYRGHADLQIDTEVLNSLLAQPSIATLENARHQFGASFAQGFQLPDAPAFEAWLQQRQETWQMRHQHLLEQLIKLYTTAGKQDAAVAVAQEWQQRYPWQEAAHRQLMVTLAAAGQPEAALAHFSCCQQRLQAELGVAPSAETMAVYEQIRHTIANTIPSPQLTAEPLSARTGPRKTNIQPALTPFWGRKQELAALAERLQRRDYRLISVVGGGGMGKTRLALEAAIEAMPHFADGVFFVGLAAVQEPSAIVPAIGEILGLTFSDPYRSAAEQLMSALQEREMLLVLDNFEHLLDGVPLLLDLLAAPQLLLLVTTREQLNVSVEDCFVLTGLTMPESTVDVDPMTAAFCDDEQFAAICLFAERARRVHKEFRLTAERLPDVIRICQLVEGMPLGIELAANWSGQVSCRQIAQEIEENVDFLSTTARDLPERQRSLRAVFNYSWQLLTAGEQQHVQQLSVFRGAFDVSAAKAIAGINLVELTHLSQKSLLQSMGDGRYALHELLRQFLMEKLQQDVAQSQAAYAQHSAYYLALLAAQRPQLASEEMGVVLATIGHELDNVLAAWEWTLRDGDLQLIQTAWPVLFTFYLSNRLQEGSTVFGNAVARLRRRSVTRSENNQNGIDSVLTALLARQGFFARRTGQYTLATQLLEESSRLAEAQADLHEQGYISLNLGAIGWALGDYATAQRHFQTYLANREAVNDGAGMWEALNQLGLVAWRQGAFAEAERAYQRAMTLTTHHDLGDLFMGRIHNGLGLVALARGEYAEAKSRFTLYLASRRSAGNRWGIADALANLGDAELMLQCYGEAGQLYRESLAIREAIGDQRGMGNLSDRFGQLAVAQGKLVEASEFYHSSLLSRQEIGDQWGIATTSVALGALAVTAGQTDPGVARLVEGLQIAHRLGALSVVLAALARLVPNLPPDTQRLRAQLVTLVSHHPASEAHTRRLVEGELKSGILDPELVEAAQVGGESPLLCASVEAVLALPGLGMGGLFPRIGAVGDDNAAECGLRLPQFIDAGCQLQPMRRRDPARADIQKGLNCD